MNERIRLLAALAGFNLWQDEEWNPGDVVDWSSKYDDELVKFAELIVREVLGQVDEFSRLTKAYQKQGIDPEIDVTKEVLKNLGFPRFPRS